MAALRRWPGSGRAAWIAGWKLVGVPWSASSDIAQAMSAAHARRFARVSASDAIAVMNCVPLISERPSFAASTIGSSPAARSASRPRGARRRRRLALADQRQREVREWGEIAARPDRATRRNVRHESGDERSNEQLDGLDARARVSLRERVRPEEHRRADDVVGIGLADAARVAPRSRS